MAVNIEIKARTHDRERLYQLAQALSDQPEKTLVQHDVFFVCARGMLKLRQINGAAAELIAYEREQGDRPRPSTYVLAPVAGFEATRLALSGALGEIAEVRKTRTLLLSGRTRIHLDQVEGLGDFVELEVVLGPDDDEASGRAEAESLMQRLEIDGGDLLDRTYAEMLSGNLF
jgi:predicted adenylyl cyclase CyaB